MNILIIGSSGNMGRRYKAIIRSLQRIDIDILFCDLYNEQVIYDNPPKADRCIIATPINQHFRWCLWAARNKIPFLCEKPVSQSLKEIATIKAACGDLPAYMVNNWAFALNSETTFMYLVPGKNEIRYDYYNSGKDGKWDLIQPIYLSSWFDYKNESPVFDVLINGYSIMQQNFDRSYVFMIKHWLDDDRQYLWTLDDAMEAGKMVLK